MLPDNSHPFAVAHGDALWRCLCAVLRVLEALCAGGARDSPSLPLAFGGIGLRSAVRTVTAAYWASWGDSLEMIAQRHPRVSEVFVRELIKCNRERPKKAKMSFGVKSHLFE